LRLHAIDQVRVRDQPPGLLKALGLTNPPVLLAIADAVIE
jgi:hypothetical protein